MSDYTTEEIQNGFANFCESHDCEKCPVFDGASDWGVECSWFYKEYYIPELERQKQ